MDLEILSYLDDEEVLENCQKLEYSVEIGEFHERDRFSWAEPVGYGEDKVHKEVLDFKINHIKQTVSVLLVY